MARFPYFVAFVSRTPTGRGGPLRSARPTLGFTAGGVGVGAGAMERGGVAYSLEAVAWTLAPHVHVAEAVDGDDRQVVDRLAEVVQRVRELVAVGRQEVHRRWRRRGGNGVKQGRRATTTQHPKL